MKPDLYIFLYYIFLLIYVLALQSCGRKKFFGLKPILDNRFWSIFLLLFVFCHITFRPLDPLFGDTERYATFFLEFTQIPEDSKDVGFDYLVYLCSSFMNLTAFFGTIALIYILPPYFAFKRVFKKHYFWALAMFVTSFSFWAYGVNGLRNGMATSLVLAGMLYSPLRQDSAIAVRTKRKKTILAWTKSVLFFLFAIGFHKSSLLPVALFVMTRFYKNSKVYLVVWAGAVLLSLTAGDFYQGYLANSDVSRVDARLSTYILLDDTYDELFSQRGFRFDFLLYSMAPIVLGCLYIFKYKFRDPLYIQLFNVYLGANAFWILVVRVAFSNRFAYLSWFLLPVVMIYPLLVAKLVKAQSQKITFMVLFSYLFTLLMYLVKL